MELLLGIGLWLLAILVLFVVFALVIGEKYFPSVMGFSSLGRVIRNGMLAICCTGAFFLFLPLVARIDVEPVKREVAKTLGQGVANLVTPMVSSVQNMIQKGLLMLAVAATLLVAIGVLIVIFAFRESLEKKNEVYQRRHLFEYQQQVFEKINKDSLRS